MKETIDSTPVRPTGEDENFANRKLIRPALPRVEHNHGNHNSNHNSNHMPVAERRERHDRPERGQDRGPDRGYDRGERSAPGGGGGRKAAPPEQTNAENFYYQKQMQSRTPMVIVLQDGEEVHGIIEWYDKTCIKVIREDRGPNLMIYKPAIKYMFKEEESGH
ncbi:MAG TPA: RNA chaperone Hfq [Candidatus Sulfotelmatobacter sp.]|jgi:sRNA-binding regulator protein Hfq|nr:RNA chaperone Hfq [Candidatus Sulfotelmatobacter sp.]